MFQCIYDLSCESVKSRLAGHGGKKSGVAAAAAKATENGENRKRSFSIYCCKWRFLSRAAALGPNGAI
jgi:hypothetical protein